MPKLNFPQWDLELFTWINSRQIEWLNPFMQTLSSHYSWIILFSIIAYFMIRRSRSQGLREVLLIAVTVITNSILNNVLKIIIKRPRPCHNELLESTIGLLEDCGNHYSFFSAHSSNAFCLAICTALYFKNKYFTLIMTLWASLVAFSRIYVGKHYPLDVLCGVIFGIMMSYAGNYYLRNYRKEPLTEPGPEEADI